MEVGAVKQAFNNEIILLKKKLNQARIHIIHKLTRKAKTLVEKKVPDPLKEKLKRKAESAVKEVLILKKIKARDLGRFIITHEGELKAYLNRPQVDNDKVCARLLLHKSLEDKYTFIKKRFSGVPIKDLFMSRQERLKLKKEEREKSKTKKNKNKDKVTNSEGDWEVEDVKSDNTNALGLGSVDDDDLAGDSDVSLGERGCSDDEEMEEFEVDFGQENKISVSNNNSDSDNENNIDSNSDDDEGKEDANEIRNLLLSDNKVLTKSNNESNVSNKKMPNNDIKIPSNYGKEKLEIDNVTKGKFKIIEKEILKKQQKKQKEGNKNKNFNDKIINRKFKKDVDAELRVENKIVDPFFITATGENYMSIVEPRQPDEIKEEHKQGNRKLRRAVMFGHIPKSKPRNNFRQNNYESNFPEKQNGNQRYNKFGDKSDMGMKKNYNKQDNFDNKFNSKKIKPEDPKPEKLHPSWEAKKKQSGILPFQGKKIVFNE